jgi:hypothetical protein
MREQRMGRWGEEDGGRWAHAPQVVRAVVDGEISCDGCLRGLAEGQLAFVHEGRTACDLCHAQDHWTLLLDVIERLDRIEDHLVFGTPYIRPGG